MPPEYPPRMSTLASPRRISAATQDDDDGAANGRVAAWTLLAIIIFFKLGTAAVILWYAKPASDAFAILIAFHWYLLVPLLMLTAGPALFWYRLVRVRSRREQLRRSEWTVQ